jgi:hypothetical protein
MCAVTPEPRPQHSSAAPALDRLPSPPEEFSSMPVSGKGGSSVSVIRETTLFRAGHAAIPSNFTHQPFAKPRTGTIPSSNFEVQSTK